MYASGRRRELVLPATQLAASSCRERRIGVGNFKSIITSPQGQSAPISQILRALASAVSTWATNRDGSCCRLRTSMGGCFFALAEFACRHHRHHRPDGMTSVDCQSVWPEISCSSETKRVHTVS